MINLLLALAVAATPYTIPTEALKENDRISQLNPMDEIKSIVYKGYGYPETTSLSLNKIKNMLQKESPTLNASVINKTLTTLTCAQSNHTAHNNILTIIDYSLPSSAKRLWVFDLKNEKLLFNTYVSHGINSGELLTASFSNTHNSKSSSLGVFNTEASYRGRHGLSLRLSGLEKGFNDNASNRAIVMHGGWYVEERFIKKYGRAGRSWGCPALPTELTEPVINTIKDKSLFVVYYPSDHWFLKSRFLNCNSVSPFKQVASLETGTTQMVEESHPRDAILFADLNNNKKHEENEPVVVMAADNYARVFNLKAPLTRMLRRQINNIEYIVLSNMELKNLVDSDRTSDIGGKSNLDDVYFVIPVVKMDRGYYATEMKMLNYGRIKEVKFNQDSSGLEPTAIQITSDTKPLFNLRTTNQFIRWLGL